MSACALSGWQHLVHCTSVERFWGHPAHWWCNKWVTSIPAHSITVRHFHLLLLTVLRSSASSLPHVFLSAGKDCELSLCITYSRQHEPSHWQPGIGKASKTPGSMASKGFVPPGKMAPGLRNPLTARELAKYTNSWWDGAWSEHSFPAGILMQPTEELIGF